MIHRSSVTFFLPAYFMVVLFFAAIIFLSPACCLGDDDSQSAPAVGGMAPRAPRPQPDALDFPALPSPPYGPAMPLPPVFSRTSKPPSSMPLAGGLNLREGTGDYAGMLLIPAGNFDMGSPDNEGRPDERPVHKVFVRDYYLARHEVTVTEYCDFLNSEGENTADGLPRVKLDSPSCPLVKTGKRFHPRKGWEDKPIVCVSWQGAADYARWAGGRLPTAAEWEKAARLTIPHPAADRFAIPEADGPLPVRDASPEALGVTGMAGNVWEWCSDWYAKDYYAESPAQDPAGPGLGLEKEIRGGSWASPEASLRSQNRYKASPRGYFRTVGFRIVKE